MIFGAIPIVICKYLPKGTIWICPPRPALTQVILADSGETIELALDDDFLRRCGIIRNVRGVEDEVAESSDFQSEQ